MDPEVMQLINEYRNKEGAYEPARPGEFETGSVCKWIEEMARDLLDARNDPS